MPPISIPINPAVPDEPFYGPEKLYTVKRFNRDSYREAMGEEAPTFDPNRPPKDWLDTAVLGNKELQPTDLVPYVVFAPSVDGVKLPTQATLLMTVHEASTINLPGNKAYPKYVIKPTDAFMRGVAGDVQPLNPKNLATPDEAQLLLKAWNLPGNSLAEQQFYPWQITYPTNTANADNRRFFVITLKTGEVVQASTFVQEMYANGVGAPGHWNLDGAEPNWISEVVSSLPATLPSRAIPVRRLAANEAITFGPFSPIIVYRKDKESIHNPAKPAGGSTGTNLTPEQIETINRIDKNVKLLVMMGSGGTTTL